MNSCASTVLLFPKGNGPIDIPFVVIKRIKSFVFIFSYLILNLPHYVAWEEPYTCLYNTKTTSSYKMQDILQIKMIFSLDPLIWCFIQWVSTPLPSHLSSSGRERFRWQVLWPERRVSLSSVVSKRNSWGQWQTEYLDFFSPSLQLASFISTCCQYRRISL